MKQFNNLKVDLHTFILNKLPDLLDNKDFLLILLKLTVQENAISGYLEALGNKDQYK